LGQYTFAAGTGSVVLTSDGANQYIFADAVRWYRIDEGDEVIVDDPAATYQGTWTEATSSLNQYGTSERYYYAPIKVATLGSNEPIGAIMQSGRLTSNHLCGT